jgi:hypothetical protein
MATLTQAEINQIISGYSSLPSMANVAQNLIVGITEGNNNKLLAAGTDATKIMLFYAGLIDSALPGAYSSLLVDVVDLVNQYDSLSKKIENGQEVRLKDWLTVVKGIENSLGSLGLVA